MKYYNLETMTNEEREITIIIVTIAAIIRIMETSEEETIMPEMGIISAEILAWMVEEASLVEVIPRREDSIMIMGKHQHQYQHQHQFQGEGNDCQLDATSADKRDTLAQTVHSHPKCATVVERKAT